MSWQRQPSLRVRALLPIALAFVVVAAASQPAAQRWTPDALATAEYESSPTFSPEGREVFFMRADRSFQNYRLLRSICTRSGWSAPEPPPFAAPAPVLEGDPFLTRDGRRLYFISSRKGVAEARGNEDLDVWFVDRLPDGGWPREAARLPEPINSTSSELLPRLAANGDLWFGSDRPGGVGGTDIYRATLGPGGAWTVANLGPPVSTPHNDYEAEISRDGKTLIVVSDRGDRSHLYRYRRRLGRWVERDRLSALPNVFQVGPLLSPAGDRILFAQADGERSGEMFLLDLVGRPNRAWPPACPPRPGGSVEDGSPTGRTPARREARRVAARG